MRGSRTQPRHADWFFETFTTPRGPLTRKQKFQRVGRAARHMLIILLFIVLLLLASAYVMYRNGWHIGPV